MTVIGLSQFKTYAMSPSMVSYHIYSLSLKRSVILGFIDFDLTSRILIYS